MTTPSASVPRRAAVLDGAAVALLAGPLVLAFFSGGYFAGPRLVAAAVAWLLVAVAVACAPRAYRPGGHAAVALGALAGLAGWTALSTTWAPLERPALESLERALLYLAACTAAVLVFGERRRARWLEPAFAFGIFAVVAYGLSGRLLPGLVELERTASAGGRLDQPLTYWNAQGALTAIGLVLCVRLAGDPTRRTALRSAAAAVAAPLAAGAYLTFSRGALSALVVGLATVLALAPSWAQLRAGALALEAGAVAVVAASLLPAVRAGEGDGASRDGAIMLAVTVAAMALAALGQERTAAAERDGAVRTGPLPAAGPLRRAALVAAVAAALAPFAIGALPRGDTSADPAFGATADRLASLDSDRFGYWRVALGAFADDPVAGTGAGGFRAVWLRERDVPDLVRDAHSVEIEHLAELGLVGLALLVGAFAAIGLAARRLARTDPALAAGPAAALAVWLAHSAIDWDWEMPALTLVAAVLAGGVLARARAPR